MPRQHPGGPSEPGDLRLSGFAAHRGRTGGIRRPQRAVLGSGQMGGGRYSRAQRSNRLFRPFGVCHCLFDFRAQSGCPKVRHRTPVAALFGCDSCAVADACPVPYWNFAEPRILWVTFERGGNAAVFPDCCIPPKRMGAECKSLVEPAILVFVVRVLVLCTIWCRVFVEKQLVRNIILFGILALITPDILLLLPCWLTGVAAYIYRERFSLPPRRARWSFAVTVAVAVLIFALLPQLPFTQGHPGLWFSSCFLSDWIEALAIGAVIVTFDAAKFSAIPASAASIARYTSDHTFSLYLYHYPLLVFANAFLPLGHDPFRHALCATAVIVVVLLLSMVTEGRRDAWRKFFLGALISLHGLGTVVRGLSRLGVRNAYRNANLHSCATPCASFPGVYRASAPPSNPPGLPV